MGVLFSLDSHWDKDELAYVPLEGLESIEICNVPAVVFCTSYSTNISYLHLNRRIYSGNNQENSYVPKGCIEFFINSLSTDLGHVTPANRINDVHLRWGLYRHALMRNPSMMYFYNITD